MSQQPSTKLVVVTGSAGYIGGQTCIELKKQVRQIEEKTDNTSKFKWLFIVLGSIILIIILIALYV